MSKIKNIPKQINGDTIVGMVNSQKIKDLGWMDVASLSSWYQDDPEKNHLGVVELFSSMADHRLPVYKNFFSNKNVLTVNGANGKFRYDLRVTKPSGVYTTEDTSDYSEYPGIDGTVFPIKLGSPYTVGDVLTYDGDRGEQVIVSEDHEVQQEGDSWVHWVKYVTNNSFGYFPAEKLKKGIQYFKVGHGLGEYSEKFSNIEDANNVGTITCEFTLGNHRGVESFYTMYADMKKIGAASIRSQEYWDYFMNEMASHGTDEFGRDLDMFYVGKLDKSTGKIKGNTLTIGASLEYLVTMELLKIESHQLLFQKAAVIKDINGTKRLNEGMFPQMRRGRVIKYSKKGGITRNHLREGAAYIFRNTRKTPAERHMKWKCGYMAYLNVLEIFRDEVLHQLQGLQPFLGTDRLLPKSPISGKNLNSLELESVMFSKVFIPELGNVEIEYDPSLDYTPLADAHSQGFYGDGFSHSSYSMVIWDVMSEEYSNAFTGLPAGTKLMTGGNERANMFYVKPEGQSLFWGYTNGRYAGDTGREVISSMKRMGREVWAHNLSACWIRDLSRTLIIELKM